MSKLTTQEVRAFENRLKAGLSFDENELDLTAYGELTAEETVMLEDYSHLQLLLDLWQEHDDLVAKAKGELLRLQNEKERLQGDSKFEKVSEWARWATGKVASNAQIAEIEQTQVEQRNLLTALKGNTFSDTTISSLMDQLMLTVEMLEQSLPKGYTPPVEVVSDDESEAAAEERLETEIDEQHVQQLPFSLDSLEVVDVDAELARQAQQARLTEAADSLRTSPELTVSAREESPREALLRINDQQQQQVATPSDADELFDELVVEETRAQRSGSASPIGRSASNRSLASEGTDLGELMIDEQQRRSPSPIKPEIIRPVAILASSPAKKMDETAAVEALVHQMVEQVLDEVDSPLVEEKSKVVDFQAHQQDLPEQRGDSELLESNEEPPAKMTAVELSEPLVEIELGPVATALMAEVDRLQTKADMSMGWSLSALWHGNYQAKAQAVKAAVAALQGEEKILTDQQVIDAVNDSSSALYQALNQHSSYLFQMTVNTPSGNWTAPQARALLNIQQAIELQQTAEDTASVTL